MATTFLEPGGDADFLIGTTNGFWTTKNDAPSVVTDFVHGTHVKSIKYRPSDTVTFDSVEKNGVLQDSGSRISFYIYLVALPSSNLGFISFENPAGIFLKSTGKICLFSNGSQMGSDGPTLSTGVWYRISLAYTITSSSVNRFELFVDGVSAVSVTNGSLSGTGSSTVIFGNYNSDTALDFRSSDHYVDNSSSLTDPGDIWITAKRPNANGTTNGFSTQIGAGGSGYGSGHSPQVNERDLSTTNGWSVVAVGATTEEYNIESASTGDIDLTGATIVDYVGWVSAKALVSETASIIVNGATSNISLTSTTTLFQKVAGSSTYPSGSGTDIGIITDATATTVSLYECGIIVAYYMEATSNIGSLLTMFR